MPHRISLDKDVCIKQFALHIKKEYMFADLQGSFTCHCLKTLNIKGGDSKLQFEIHISTLSMKTLLINKISSFTITTINIF